MTKTFIKQCLVLVSVCLGGFEGRKRRYNYCGFDYYEYPLLLKVGENPPKGP